MSADLPTSTPTDRQSRSSHDDLDLRANEQLDDAALAGSDADVPFVVDEQLLAAAAEVDSAPVEDEIPHVFSPAALGSFLVALCCSIFVFGLVNWPRGLPEWGTFDFYNPATWQALLFVDTTPSGGDMGAHVWGPAYMRDNLLPEGRLTGWTPDWYAGFPAYQFYMVVPALAIIAVNAGLPWYLGIPLAAAALIGANKYSATMGRARPWILAAAGLLAVLLVSFPYGVAFKIVSVSGLVLFPMAAWAMGRLARCPEPIPGFLSLGSLMFLFDTNFSIYGGNIASTLAGEFAFSISLCLALLAIGVTIRAMDSGGGLAPTAILISLVALCHIIPVMFLVAALVVAVLVHREVPRIWALLFSLSLAAAPLFFGNGQVKLIGSIALPLAVVILIAAAVAEREVTRRAVWLLVTGPLAILLGVFWILPFMARGPYFNDMGWERLDEVREPLLTVPMQITLPVAAIGLLLAYSFRDRIGMIFAATGGLSLSAIVYMPESALWNARILPFFYLSAYFLAAVGLAYVVRFIGSSVSAELKRPEIWTTTTATAFALIIALVTVSLPLRILPGGAVEDGTYRWLAFSNSEGSFIPSWVHWNYSGYERKKSFAEYSHVVETMDIVGQTEGCGRAMWEYEKGLDRYGTPMALMLLPFWTDGCIGSMEGLYFESSASTPFHFLNQSTMSESPSRAQRDLPYLGFNVATGVEQLQLSGVKYYMAQTDEAITQADAHPDLTRVVEAQPFVVFAVANSELVEGLSVEPVIVTGPTNEQTEDEEDLTTRFDIGWVSQAVEHYNAPSRFAALPAEDGPASWTEQQILNPTDGTPVRQAVVSNIEVDTSEIRFDVDEIGTPVLVKTSYFPNWKAQGADGPWRAGPNMMVVVPTSTSVALSYGYTGVDLLSMLLTGLAIAIVAWLAWSNFRVTQASMLRIFSPQSTEPHESVGSGRSFDSHFENDSESNGSRASNQEMAGTPGEEAVDEYSTGEDSMDNNTADEYSTHEGSLENNTADESSVKVESAPVEPALTHPMPLRDSTVEAASDIDELPSTDVH